MTSLVADLQQLIAPERVLHQKEHLLTYGFDGTAVLNSPATCVVLPETTEEVVLSLIHI